MLSSVWSQGVKEFILWSAGKRSIVQSTVHGTTRNEARGFFDQNEILQSHLRHLIVHQLSIPVLWEQRLISIDRREEREGSRFLRIRSIERETM